MTTENKRDLVADLVQETKRDLLHDLAICEAATPGPWHSSTNRHPEFSGKPWGSINARNGIQIGTWSGSRNANYSADNRYVTEAREGWPEAIRRAIEAEAEVERLRRDKRLLTACYDGQSARAGEYYAEIKRLKAELTSEEDKRCFNEMLADSLASENAKLRESLETIIHISKQDGISFELDRCYVIARDALKEVTADAAP